MSAAVLGAEPSHAPREPGHSLHTGSFGPLLEELRVSLVVSTYHAGKPVVLRAAEGVVNTHLEFLLAFRERGQ